MPERLETPEGGLGPERSWRVLTEITPVRTARVTRMARPRSPGPERTRQTRRGCRWRWWTASSSVSKGITEATGPKISSWATRHELSTSAQDGRGQIPARTRRLRLARHSGTFGATDADVVEARRSLTLRDQRAELGRLVEGIADVETPAARRRIRRRNRRRRFAGPGNGTGRSSPARCCRRPTAGGCGDGSIEVGVGEDDAGRLASEFERDPGDVVSARTQDPCAGGGLAGEADLVDPGIGDERVADGRSRPADARSPRRRVAPRRPATLPGAGRSAG